MRKIELEMLKAIKQGVNKSLSNTVVLHDNIDQCHVYLHGNKIALISSQSIKINMCGWATVTTRARLNAILKPYKLGITQRKGIQYLINSENALIEINSNSQYEILINY